MLLRRCFFQDVERNIYGDVQCVKIHDLMHDVALEVGGKEIGIVTSVTNNVGDKVRHVHYVDERDGASLDINLSNRKILSYICRDGHFIDTQVENWMWLRALKLSFCGVEKLPDSIGKLLHLRYLDLSNNYNLKELCDSVTKLYNLQILDLSSCHNIKELPKGISKLMKLRHLKLDGCYDLSCMPPDMDKLSNLRGLSLFVVGNKENSSGDGMLKDLKALWKIQGDIVIRIGENYRNVEDMNDAGRYLKSMDFLRELEIEFNYSTMEYEIEDNWAKDEAMLDKLEAPRNLKGFVLREYKGKRIGSWGRVEDDCAVSLPLLVRIEIIDCRKLEHMPMLSQMLHLKSLQLTQLDSFEYMENAWSNCGIDTKAVTNFFPSLEILEIKILPKLKGWWKRESLVHDLKFPHLSRLLIFSCPNLTSFAPCPDIENIPKIQLPRLIDMDIRSSPNFSMILICPSLEELNLFESNKRLQITSGNSRDDADFVKLSKVAIGGLGDIELQPSNCLTILRISRVESSPKVDAFQCCVSSIRVLFIYNCPKLRGLAHLKLLTGLESLTLRNIEEMSIYEEDDEEPWKSRIKSLSKGMQHLTSLQFLQLSNLKSMNELPEWMCCSSSLGYLSIYSCPGIKSLPESIKDLSSLNSLRIHRCPDLEERCKKADGEDFPKIEHIPHILINGEAISKSE